MKVHKRSQLKVTPRAKVWFELDGEYAFGLGICRILEAVEETGAIKSAAASLEKSYRHVWSRIKEVEQTLGLPLVETQVGGSGTRRSTLTQPARELIQQFRELREQVFALVDDRFSKQISGPARPVNKGR